MRLIRKHAIPLKYKAQVLLNPSITVSGRSLKLRPNHLQIKIFSQHSQKQISSNIPIQYLFQQMQIVTMKNHQRFKFLSKHFNFCIPLNIFSALQFQIVGYAGQPLIRPNQTDQDNQKDTVRALKLLTRNHVIRNQVITETNRFNEFKIAAPLPAH